MRKTSAHVISSKRVALSRAAALLSNFVNSDNGTSPTVSLYLQRAALAFNFLSEYHNEMDKTTKKYKKTPSKDSDIKNPEFETDDKSTKKKRKSTDSNEEKSKKKKTKKPKKEEDEEL